MLGGAGGARWVCSEDPEARLDKVILLLVAICWAASLLRGR